MRAKFLPPVELAWSLVWSRLLDYCCSSFFLQQFRPHPQNRKASFSSPHRPHVQLDTPEHGQFQWSPTENMLVFRELGSGPGGPGGISSKLWLLDADTRQTRLIADSAVIHRPVFTSDGQGIRYWKDGLPYQMSLGDVVPDLVLTDLIPRRATSRQMEVCYSTLLPKAKLVSATSCKAVRSRWGSIPISRSQVLFGLNGHLIIGTSQL